MTDPRKELLMKFRDFTDRFLSTLPPASQGEYTEAQVVEAIRLARVGVGLEDENGGANYYFYKSVDSKIKDISSPPTKK